QRPPDESQWCGGLNPRWALLDASDVGRLNRDHVRTAGLDIRQVIRPRASRAQFNDINKRAAVPVLVVRPKCNESCFHTLDSKRAGSDSCAGALANRNGIGGVGKLPRQIGHRTARINSEPIAFGNDLPVAVTSSQRGGNLWRLERPAVVQVDRMPHAERPSRST